MAFTHSYAQLTFSERVEYSEIATPKEKPLFFVDFWATWCVPCIHVSTYLNTLQEQFRDDLYIVSLTKEPSNIVRPFLEKHPTRLAVSIDYEGTNFNNYKVKVLPYGILFNAKGDILWQGNPANITPKIIRTFLSKNNSKIPIYDFLKYSSYENEAVSDFILDKDFEIRNIKIAPSSSAIIERAENITSVKGSLSQIVAYLLKVNERQISVKENHSQYELLIKENHNNSLKEKEIANHILKNLGYRLKKENRAGKIIEIWLPSDTSKYWTTNQIDWGEKNAKFLVDDSQFYADNISVSDFLYKLSEVTDLPVVIKTQNLLSNELFDWQLHYKFADLMYANLLELGIQASESSGNYSKYFIEKE